MKLIEIVADKELYLDICEVIEVSYNELYLDMYKHRTSQYTPPVTTITTREKKKKGWGI